MSNLQEAKRALELQKWEEQQKEREIQEEKERLDFELDIQTHGMENVLNSGKYPIWRITNFQMKSLGKQIKAERKNKGWKQKELAKRAMCSATTIGRLEKHGWGSPITIMKAAAALGKQLTIN